VTRWLLPFVAMLALGASEQERPRFAVRTDLVRVNVLVTDGGRPVRGLGPEDFEIRDNGVLQNVDRVLNEHAPIDAWLLLDESGSVRNQLDALTAAAGAFTEKLDTGDRSGLITFRHMVSLRSTLTGDRSRMTSQVGLATAQGYTSMRDAIFVALAMREDSLDRSLIVVFSDGLDTMSWLTDEQLMRAAAQSDAVIYGVTGSEVFEDDHDDGLAVSWRSRPGLLRDLAEQTGGTLLKTDARSNLSAVFAGIVAEMKARYSLTFYPSGVSPNGSHRLEVKVKGRRARVRARRGYFASDAGTR
jgi:VWFA-related protein